MRSNSLASLSALLRRHLGLTLIQYGARLCRLTCERVVHDAANPGSWASVLATDDLALMAAAVRILDRPGAEKGEEWDARIH
jgi:hypothetical protein